jgi:hypothetical protein
LGRAGGSATTSTMHQKPGCSDRSEDTSYSAFMVLCGTWRCRPRRPDRQSSAAAYGYSGSWSPGCCARGSAARRGFDGSRSDTDPRTAKRDLKPVQPVVRLPEPVPAGVLRARSRVVQAWSWPPRGGAFSSASGRALLPTRWACLDRHADKDNVATPLSPRVVSPARRRGRAARGRAESAR